MMSTGNPVQADGGRYLAPLNQLIKLEQEATRMYLNQPLFVPGLLQVPGYAREMISRTTGLEPGDPALTERVKVRTQRAENFAKRLEGTDPPQLWAVIDEAVLRRTVGGAAVMRDQLEHLVAVSKLDAVHLAVVPLGHGAHPGLGGSVEVHEGPDGQAAVFFEGAHGDELVEGDPALARRYQEKVKSAFASGVSGAEVRTLLESIIGTL
jgi:hypothetical protein